MKTILVCDANKMFQQFVKEKLTAEKIDVVFADSKRDGFLRMIDKLPELLIIDHSGDEEHLTSFLDQKLTNPNTIKVPTIIMGPKQSHEKVAQLAKYKVIKYFSKPIRYDALFESISNTLKVPIPIDTTPCILDAHLNDDIIFVEIAQGLNREKIGLLKYRISEIIDQNEMTQPKVVIMMTGLSLDFVDGSNLELLFDNVTSDRRVRNHNVKILSFDKFTRELIEGHPQYKGFEVVTSLADVLSSLVDSAERSSTLTDTITDKILSANSGAETATVQLQFENENRTDGILNPEWEKAPAPKETPIKEETKRPPINVAVVDDDPKTCMALKSAFMMINANCDIFNSGLALLSTLGTKKYDAISLDIFMPGASGLDVLNQMRMKNITIPTVVYSQIFQKETVMQALSLGAKTYLYKQQHSPDVVAQNILEALKK